MGSAGGIWLLCRNSLTWFVCCADTPAQVYNISPYLRFHPGGSDILMKAAGKDGTTLFNKYHPWVNAHALLEKCLIGLLHKPEGAQEAQQQSLKSKLTSFFK